MWVAVRDVLTPCGWVARGRIVADGDDMLVGCEDAFARAHDGDTIETAGGGSAAERSGKRVRR